MRSPVAERTSKKRGALWPGDESDDSANEIELAMSKAPTRVIVIESSSDEDEQRASLTRPKSTSSSHVVSKSNPSTPLKQIKTLNGLLTPVITPIKTKAVPGNQETPSPSPKARRSPTAKGPKGDRWSRSESAIVAQYIIEVGEKHTDWEFLANLVNQCADSTGTRSRKMAQMHFMQKVKGDLESSMGLERSFKGYKRKMAADCDKPEDASTNGKKQKVVKERLGSDGETAVDTANKVAIGDAKGKEKSIEPPSLIIRKIMGKGAKLLKKEMEAATIVSENSASPPLESDGSNLSSPS